MKKGDIALLALLMVMMVVSGIYVWRLQSDNLTAVVIQDGRVVREIDLTTLQEPIEFRVDTGWGGYNIVQAEPGRIRVLSANCPEQVDVRQGWISHPYQSIVCLPHRLVIQIRATEPPDIDDIVR